MKTEIFVQLLDELDELTVLVHESFSLQGLLSLLFLLTAVGIGVLTSSLWLAAVAVVGGLSLASIAAALNDALRIRLANR